MHCPLPSQAHHVWLHGGQGMVNLIRVVEGQGAKGAPDWIPQHNHLHLTEQQGEGRGAGAKGHRGPQGGVFSMTNRALV